METMDDAWLVLGKDDVPPDAVRALYERLPDGVSQTCERAMKRMRSGYRAYLEGLKVVRDALAPSGKFKEWCEAYGLNYGTAKNQLTQASKLADNEKLSARPPNGGPRTLTVRFATGEDRAEMVAALRDVCDAEAIEGDDWRAALDFLAWFYFEHEPFAREAVA